MAAELPERRKRDEADTSESYAVLEVEVEGRRADQARAVGLEKQVSTSISISISISSTRSLFASSSWLSDLGRSFFHHSKCKKNMAYSTGGIPQWQYEYRRISNCTYRVYPAFIFNLDSL